MIYRCGGDLPRKRKRNPLWGWIDTGWSGHYAIDMFCVKLPGGIQQGKNDMFISRLSANSVRQPPPLRGWPQFNER